MFILFVDVVLDDVFVVVVVGTGGWLGSVHKEFFFFLQLLSLL